MEFEVGGSRFCEVGALEAFPITLARPLPETSKISRNE